MYMSRIGRNIMAICALSMLIAGGVLAASAARTDDTSDAAPAWSPKQTEWSQFRHDAARSGLTTANASMRLAYYKWAARTGSAI